MKSLRRLLPVAERLERRCLLAAQPIITEFVASNRDSLLDGSSPPESPDWIEVYNSGDETVDLEGWFLTDDAADLDKWMFPKRELPPSAYEIVFASGQGNQDLLGNLHTNFRLRAAGEYLALVHPDGRTVASEFGSPTNDYPQQVSDVSFGRAMQPLETGLVQAGATARVLVPQSDVDDWAGLSFDDRREAGWSDVTLPVGFGVGVDALVASDVEEELHGNNSSLFTRIAFEVADPTRFDRLRLDLAFDDGFAAFLNGQRIASTNAAESLSFDSAATASNDIFGQPVQLDPSQASIWYSFEGSGGQAVSDELTEDGAQTPSFNSGGSIDAAARRAAFGTRSLRLPESPGPEFFNWIQIPETQRLGDKFTLAAHIDSSAGGLQRIFSNFNGMLPVQEERLIFDFDPSGVQVPGLRFVIGNRGVVETDDVPAALLEEGYHHVAASYDDGTIQLYVDGQLVAGGVLGSGPVVTPLDLLFGEDPHDGGGTENEQFVGNVDDILVLTGVVLSPDDVRLLAEEGAEALLTSGGNEPVFNTFDVSQHLELLEAGQNVLAIQALNVAATDADFYLDPRLVGITQPEKIAEGYFDPPTPGSRNPTPLRGLVAPVEVSNERGFYAAEFALDIRTPTPGAALAYTLDGTEPTFSNGIVVVAEDSSIAPVARIDVTTTTILRVRAFQDQFVPSDTVTHSYVFLADVVNQPHRPEGYPTRWGPTRADYEMDPEVVDVSPFRETIIDDLQSIPSISLALSNDDFFGPDGIYANTLSRGRAWEKPVSVEYVDPGSNDQFQINAGLRVHGGFSRNPSASPQHSLRLHFRSEYGEGKLRFPLFSDSDVSTFDSLVLNAQSSDNWSSVNTLTGRVAQFMRDQWAQDIQREMEQPHVPGRYVHVYINGLYWGLYGLMERPDDDFAAEHFGGHDDEYDVIVDENANSGNLSAWNELLSRVRARELDRVDELLDLDNFIDYMILNIYMGNWDWPDHNWNAVRRRVEGEKFYFLVWDAEVGLGLDVNVPGPIRPRILDVDLAGRRRDVGSGDVRNGPGEIYDRLRTLPEFQLRFADRLHKHLFNGGALTRDRAAGVYAARAQEIESALVGQAARWGDVRRSTPDVPDGVWADERDWIVETFFSERPVIALEDFRDEGLYPNVVAPIFKRHGGIVPANFNLEVTNPNDQGTVFATIDGTDPRSPGGEVAASAFELLSALRIDRELELRARIRVGDAWSAITVAHFDVGSIVGDLSGNGEVDGIDLTLLCAAIERGDEVGDLNGDRAADDQDVLFFVQDLLETFPGDVNLDGSFDSQDLVVVFQRGEYEDGVDNNSSWFSGDWNCDGEFSTADLVFAFQLGGYQP